MHRILVCGTQSKGSSYKEIVFKRLTDMLWNRRGITRDFSPLIIEGCCKDSADQYAEEWAAKEKLEIKHFPASEGTYIKRNIEMIKECDFVIAFWDGYSYGTAQTIAQAVMRRIPVSIVHIVKKTKASMDPASNRD